MKRRYPICLSDEERRELDRLLDSRPRLARIITRVRVLLLADEGKNDREIAKALRISNGTVHNVRKRFFNERSVRSLEERPRLGQPCRLNGVAAAQISELVGSKPPEGHTRWTLRLLAERAVKLDLVDAISHESVRKILEMK
ncbi:MAG: helix-turn-helix domain-containing protein [Syntrophobacteraceae bacterium]